MTNIVMALVMFTLVAYCVTLFRVGLRNGAMPLFFGYIWSLRFDRPSAPVLFWSSAVFNALLIAMFAVGGVILLVGAILKP